MGNPRSWGGGRGLIKVRGDAKSRLRRNPETQGMADLEEKHSPRRERCPPLAAAFS